MFLSINYRNFDFDMPAFTDVAPDNNSPAATNTLGAYDATRADISVGGKTYSSDMTEAGISIALEREGFKVNFLSPGPSPEDKFLG